VALSGFKKDLGWFDIQNQPAWVSSTQSTISLTGLNKYLTWADVLSKPSWITTSQSTINLSGFNRDLTWSQVLSKSSWITTLQSSINLLGFTNDLVVTPAWSSVTSKPVWTTLIYYGGVSLNFDLIFKETIVPDTTNFRNISSSTFSWNQLNVKTIVCVDVTTPNAPSMNFSVHNFMKSIELRHE